MAAEVQYWRGLGFDSVSPIVVIAEGAHAGVHWRAVAFKDHNHLVCMAVGPAGREHDSGSACWRDHDGWSQGPVAERGDDFVYGWVDARAERVRLVAAGAPAVQTDVIAVPTLGTRMFVAPAPKSPGARSATVREVILLDAAGHVLCRVTTGEHPC